MMPAWVQLIMVVSTYFAVTAIIWLAWVNVIKMRAGQEVPWENLAFFSFMAVYVIMMLDVFSFVD